MNWLGSPMSHALGWMIFHFLWQGMLLGALLLAGRSLLPARFPQARYAFTLIGFGFFLVLPVWLFDVCRQAVWIENGVPELRPAKFFHDFGFSGSSPWPGAVRAVEPLTPYLTLVWLVGMLWGLLRFGRGLYCLRSVKAAADCRNIPEDVLAVWQRLCRQLRIPSSVRLVSGDNLHSPAVLGVLRPVIYLPACLLTRLSIDEIELVFLHEMAHLKRLDPVIHYVQRVAEVVLFFHPMVWILSRRLHFDRELCCDAFVVAASGRRSAYASLLVRLSQKREPQSQLSLAMARHPLVSRVAQILEQKRKPMSKSNLFCGVGIVGLVIASLGFSRTYSQEPYTEEIYNPHLLANVENCLSCHMPSKRGYQEPLPDPWGNPYFFDSENEFIIPYHELNHGGSVQPGIAIPYDDSLLYAPNNHDPMQWSRIFGSQQESESKKLHDRSRGLLPWHDFGTFHSEIFDPIVEANCQACHSIPESQLAPLRLRTPLRLPLGPGYLTPEGILFPWESPPVESQANKSRFF